MARKPRVLSVEVVDSPDGRYVVRTYDDGSAVRQPVETDAKPRRKPRKPFARTWRPRQSN